MGHFFSFVPGLSERRNPMIRSGLRAGDARARSLRKPCGRRGRVPPRRVTKAARTRLGGGSDYKGRASACNRERGNSAKKFCGGLRSAASRAAAECLDQTVKLGGVGAAAAPLRAGGFG